MTAVDVSIPIATGSYCSYTIFFCWLPVMPQIVLAKKHPGDEIWLPHFVRTYCGSHILSPRRNMAIIFCPTLPYFVLPFYFEIQLWGQNTGLDLVNYYPDKHHNVTATLCSLIIGYETAWETKYGCQCHNYFIHVATCNHS